MNNDSLYAAPDVGCIFIKYAQLDVQRSILAPIASEP